MNVPGLDKMIKLSGIYFIESTSTLFRHFTKRLAPNDKKKHLYTVQYSVQNKDKTHWVVKR